MPNVIQGNPENYSPGSRDGKKESGKKKMHAANFDYDYPIDQNLKPGTEFHRQLKERIMRRARDSYRVISSKHSDWETIDKSLKAYVPPENNDDEEESMPKIVIPQTYATMETLLTYMFSAFIQSPIFKYEGTGPEDVLGAMLMTKLIDQQCIHSGVGLNIHTQFRDSFAYGFGAVTPQWTRKYGRKTEKEDIGTLDMFNQTITVDESRRKTSDRKLLYEGNKLENIDPYRYLPDPNMPIHEVQEAEFSGWVERTNYMNLMNRDRDNEDFVFNAKYLKFIEGTTSLLNGNPNEGNRRSTENNSLSTTSPVDVIWTYIDIIPKDWELSRQEYPETWLFGVAGDEVIVAAQPLNLDHGMKPVAVAAPDYDGYTSTPISKLEMVQDLQEMIDFLYSSHIQNVKKAINDMFVIDPKLVNYHDVADPKPGKLIRMRRAAWGRGDVDKAIKQFPVTDVTQGHVADAGYLADIMDKVSSANENLKGQLPARSSRISASEAQQVRSSGLSRLERVARIISMQSMLPIAKMFAAHTQQFMQDDTYLKVTGEWEETLKSDFGMEAERGRLNVSPMDMIVNYDVIPHDGTIPGSSDKQSLHELIQTIIQNENVASQFDLFRMVKHMARESGVKNVDDFVKRARQQTPTVKSNEDIQKEVDKGNLIPAQNGAQ